MPATVSEARELIITKPQPQVDDHTPEAEPTPQSPSEALSEKRAFTVKELGGPRKRKVTPVQPHEQDMMKLDDDDDKEQETKEEKKRRKKLRKEKKAREAQLRAANETPFDYGAAESVLNAQPESSTQPNPKQKRRAFNPYAKALEAPSGVRKQKREIAGKSHTFR
ncbi:hypothetical protein N7468_004748 [Penicillium chermesinum]|uniref:Uncharacterized protein n=1 Tax=Penicillium chermesinum TaxID=63820 RepID=A0A9W9TUM9_9EURO|nr:uncharacterized protein N7468_004748 [Penicillium chermesinum]KAJ5240129.1 hypothetical protein N7468_004748 [Penicillium chermesinum]